MEGAGRATSSQREVVGRLDAVRYFRKHAGSAVAVKLVAATGGALDRIERDPAIGSPAWSDLLGIPELRTWRAEGFPVIWFYFERNEYLDVVRLLGERQDIATILADQQ
jgi:toxin ParE1/3/4